MASGNRTFQSDAVWRIVANQCHFQQFIARCRRLPQDSPGRCSGCGLLLYRIDTIGIEGEMVPDLGDSGIGSLVAPYSILRPFPADGDVVVSAFALVGAVGAVVCPFQQRHVDVFARDVLDRRVRCLS